MSTIFTFFAPQEGVSQRPFSIKQLIDKKIIEPALSVIGKVRKPTASLSRFSTLEKEKLKKHSILSSPTHTLKEFEDISSLLGQIHAGVTVRNTTCNTLSSKDAALGCMSLLSQVSEVRIPDSLMQALHQYQKTASTESFYINDASQVQKRARELMDEVHQLPVGDSFCIEGGRRIKNIVRGAIFEFIRRDKDSFDLFVYLPEKDKKLCHDTLSRDYKVWTRPISYYQNIPADVLFFGQGEEIQPDFFEAILRARYSSVSAEYLSLRLLGHLQEFRKETPETQQFLSKLPSTQNTWALIKPLLIRYLGYENYKKVSIEMKLLSLVEGFHIAEEIRNTPPDDPAAKLKNELDSEKLRNILKTGATHLLKNLASLEINGIKLSGPLLLKARATAQDLLERIELIEKEIAEKSKKTSVDFTFRLPDRSKDTEECVRFLERIGPTSKSPKVRASISSKVPRLILLDKLDTLSADLHAFVMDFKEYQLSTREQKVCAMEIEYLVSNLSIPVDEWEKPFWSQIAKEELIPILSDLERVLNAYDRATRGVGITPQQINTVSTLYSIVHFLAVRYEREVLELSDQDPAALAHYPIFFPFADDLDDPLVFYTAPQDYLRREQLIRYFKETYENARRDDSSTTRSLFNFSTSYNFFLNQKNIENEGFPDYLRALTKRPEFPFQGKAFKALQLLANALSAATSKKKGNEFPLSGFTHLPILFRSAFLTSQFTNSKRTSEYGAEELRINITRPEDHLHGKIDGRVCSLVFETTGARVASRLKANSLDNSHREASGRLLPPLSNEYLDFLEDKKTSRQKKEDTLLAEGKALQTECSYQIRSDASHFLRSACEPELFLYKILSYYKGNFHLLEHPEEQTLFELNFFRPYVIISSDHPVDTSRADPEWTPYSRTHHFPILEEFEQEGFREEVEKFITEGVDCFYQRQPGQKPKVHAVLFFIRLASHLAQFHGGNELYPTRECLEKLLTIKDLTPEERSAIHLHLILSYKNLQKKLTGQQIESIISSWVYYKNTPLPFEWRYPLLENEAEQFIYQFGSVLESSSNTFKRSVLQTAIQQMRLRTVLSAHFKIETDSARPHLIRAVGNKGSFWEINVLTGEVLSQNGIYRRSEAPKWFSERFRHIFGDQKYSFLEAGGTFTFTDPKLGTLTTFNRGDKIVLQREIEGEDYEYIQGLSCAALPKTLRSGFTHWHNVENDFIHMDISDPTDGKRVGYVSASGRISFSNGDTVWSTNTQSAVLNDFELAGYTHLTEDSDGNHTLHFWRYKSQTNQMLAFHKQGPAAIYSANRKYRLDNVQQKGLLGTVNNYLLLTHEDRDNGSQKILVPFKPLTSGPTLTSKRSINLSATDFLGLNPLDEIYTNQKQRFVYLEFDIKKEKVIPLTQEGTLYLAYLYLAQRNYLAARSLLKKIDHREPFSPLSQLALKWIIDIGCKIPFKPLDSSPEAVAVSLHAWILAKKAYDRGTFLGKKELFIETKPPGAIKAYKRSEHLLPEDLLLSAEELDVLELTPKSATLNTQPFLRTFLPPSMQKQQECWIPKLTYPKSGFAPSSLKGWSKDPSSEEYKAWCNGCDVDRCSHFLINEVKVSRDRNTDLIEKWDTLCTQWFFRSSYEIAKRGTAHQKKLLEFKMQLGEETFSSRFYPNSWIFLQFALKYPDLAPELPQGSSYQERWDFVCAISKAIKKAAGKEPGHSDRSKEKIQVPYKEDSPSSLLAPILPPKKASDVIAPLYLQPLSKELIKEGTTEKIFARHFKKREKTAEQKVAVALPEELQSELYLTKEEKVFESVLKNEYEEFLSKYKKGQETNSKRECYDAIQLSDLKRDLSKKMGKLDQELSKLEVTLLEIANKQNPNNVPQKLLREAGIAKELNLKKLVYLFLKQDKEEFAKANPYLRDPTFVKRFAALYKVKEDPDLVIDYLYNAIALYMTLHVQKTRFSRAAVLCAKIDKCGVGEELKKDSLVQKLAEELQPNENPIYSIEEHPEFLVIEYLSGFSTFADQAALLEHFLEVEGGNYISRVGLLGMGRGKTSHLAQVILQMAAKKGRLAAFITPASQYPSVAALLRKLMREYFDKEMEEIDVERNDMTFKMCVEIEKRLEEVSDRGDFLLVKAETLQGLQLEFLDLVNQVCEKDADVTAEMIDHINVLRRILIKFKKCDALLDEVDLLLYVLQEVNFPIGKDKRISPERVDLIRELYTIFTSEAVAVDEKGTTVNLKKIIGLQKNRQNLLSKQILYGVVAHAVAFNLARNCDALKLKDYPHFHESFERYINKTMSIDCQKYLDHPNEEAELALTEEQKIDLSFLRHLRFTLRKSESAEEQEAAHQIALVKHMMQTVFPVTFSKTGKRNYGRGGEKAGEVRPYVAVATPSKNLFGYHWEAVSYHLQTALQCGISEEQLLGIAKVYKLQASLRSEREKTALDATIEATEFRELTGVSLFDLDEPEKVRQATEFLNSKVESLLRFEADTAAEYVTYFPFRLTATGHSLISMLATSRAMSGTPWNRSSYHRSLAKTEEAGEGNEGQIAAEFLRRVATNKEDRKYLHTVRMESLKQIIKGLLEKHPKKELVRMFMDSGALLKDYTNLEVAMALRDELGIPILFFIKDPATGETTPDTLAVLKVGSDIPEIIGGTRLEDIEKTGLDLEDYGVFADERHTTGLDVPLIPGAIGLMTIDEDMLRRSFFQTVLRLREFFLRQEVEFVIPDYLVEMLGKQIFDEALGNEELAVIMAALLNSIKNQAIAKSLHYFRGCKQGIDDTFRNFLLSEEGLLCPVDLTKRSIKEKFTPFKGVTLVQQFDLPYDQFGALEYEVDSVKALKAYRKYRLNCFPKDHPHYQEISELTKEIVKEAKLSPYLPEKVLEAGTSDLGSMVDILTNLASEVNLKVDHEIEAVLIKELARYQMARYDKLREEDHWEDGEIETFLEALATGEENEHKSDLIPLNSLLENSHYSYEHDFSKVFSKDLLVTRSWAYTADRPLPIFHRLQRPLDHLLIVRQKDMYQTVALSQHEAREFKNYLRRAFAAGKHPQVWLVQPDGTQLESNPLTPFNDKEKGIQNPLVECAAFNGRIDSLDSMMEASIDWLYKDDQIEARKDFLKLRIAHNPLQKKLFFVSDVFGDPTASSFKSKLRYRRMAKRLEGLGKEQIQALKEEDRGNIIFWLMDEKLNLLLPHQVKWLRANQIPELEEESLIKAIPKHYAHRMTARQMEKISEAQVQWFELQKLKTQRMPAHLIPHMSDKQIADLGDHQIAHIEDKKILDKLPLPKLSAVVGAQVEKGLIDEAQVPYLRTKSAIQALPLDWLSHVPLMVRKTCLSEAQVAALDPVKHLALIQELTDAQVGWLKTEEQLDVLNRDQWLAILPTQIEGIIRSQKMIDKLEPPQIEHIDPSIVSLIKDTYIQFLGKATQVRMVDVAKYDRLGEKALSALEDRDFDIIMHPNVKAELRVKCIGQRHVERLDPNIALHLTTIQSLEKPRIGWLILEEQLLALLDRQIPDLDPPQIKNVVRSVPMVRRLTDGQIKHIHPDAVPCIKDTQIQFLEEPDQVRALPPTKWGFITDPQAALLKEAKDLEIVLGLKPPLRRKHIQPVHIQLLDPVAHSVYIKELTYAQVKELISEEQLRALDVDPQMGWISNTQIGLIETQEMVGRLKFEQMRYLNPIAVKHIPEEGVPFLITRQQLQALKPDYFDLLGRVQISLFEKEDVELFRHLEDIQFDHLTTEQESWVTDPDVKLRIEKRRTIRESYFTPQCKNITLLVSGILLGLAVFGALLVSGLAILGMYPFAPQFTVNLYQAFGSATAIYSLMGVASLVLIGLIPYTIYCCKRSQPQKRVRRPLKHAD